MTSSANPEAGTISYTYDLDGNTLTKKDAKSITTTFAYEALNRVSSKSYSDGTPTVQYTYDAATAGIGYLASVDNSNSFYNYTAYDSMGRVMASNQQTGGSYGFGYSYDLAGHLVAETYLTGRVVTTIYNGAAQQSKVSGCVSDLGRRVKATAD